MIKRRHFLGAGLGVLSFSATLGIYDPKPSHAFLFFLALAAMGGGSSGHSPAWLRKRREIQLAQRQLINAGFQRVDVYPTGLQEQPYIVLGNRNDLLKMNDAVVFPRLVQNSSERVSFSSASIEGLNLAAKYLRDQRSMGPQEIRNALLPKFSGIGTYDDELPGWSRSFTKAYRNQVSDNGVIMEYRATDPRPGGHAELTVDIYTNHRFQVATTIEFDS